MGEVDTKPIESVQAALSLFEQKNGQKKYRPTSSEVMEKGKELDLMQKDLANYKVQLEVKESANIQALLKLEFYLQTVEDLVAQIQKSEAERDRYIEDYNVAMARIDKLETENKNILAQLLETGAEEQRLSTINELKAAQEELLNLKTELAIAEESKLSALKQAEEMENAAEMEREKTEELLKHLSELNEAIRLSKLAAIDAEKEKSTSLLAKETELQLATEAALEAHEQLEEMRKQFDVMNGLEEQLSTKSLLINSLQRELEQAKDSHISSVKAASDAIDNLNRLKLEIERLERVDSERTVCIELMKIELEQSKAQLQNARQEVDSLNHQIELTAGEMHKMKNEMTEIERRESEAQVEIATIKSEVHKNRAKIASAEAAEARAKSSTSGLYLAVQQLAMEAEEAKKESLRLKEAAKKAAKKAEADAQIENCGFGSPVEFWKSVNFVKDQISGVGELGAEAEDKVTDAHPQGFCSGITISIEEYESLIQKAEKADKIADSVMGNALQQVDYERKHDLETLREELKTANAEIDELKSITEKSLKRMELAEKAKVAVEDQLRKWREQKHRRRAALTALREELSYKETSAFDGPVYDKPSTYEPLGKVLNIKI